MAEGEVEKERIKVEIKVVKVIGMHTMGRGLGHEPEVMRRAVNSTESKFTM